MTDKVQHVLKFLVVGGGLAGLAAAIALRQAGHEVCIFEQGDGEFRSQAVMRCPPHVVRILSYLGVDTSQKPPLLGCLFVDGTTNEFLQHLQFHERMLEDLGGGCFLSRHGEIYDWLLDRARNAGAEIRFNSRVIYVDTEGPAVCLEGGVVVCGDIVVGADGWDSAVRRIVAGKPAPNERQSRAAYSVLIPEERVRSDPELSELIRDHDDNYWMGDDCLLSGLYDPQARQYFVYLICAPREDVNIERRWDASCPVNVLNLELSSFSPSLRRLVQLADNANPISYLGHASLESWVHENGNILILGDAAEPSPPHTHEGAAAALGDGLVLGTLFRHLSTPAQIPVLLGAFEEIRRPRALQLAQEASTVVSYFSLPAGAAAEQRNAAFREAQRRRGVCMRMEDEEALRIVWGDFMRIAQYDAYEKACDWWTKWGATLRSPEEEKDELIAIPVERHVQVQIEMV